MMGKDHTMRLKGAGASAVGRARAYLARIPGAISGSGGHNQTFAVACALVCGFALSEDAALDVLLEYNLRCDPPWSEGELLHKLKSARQAAHPKPFGYLLDLSGSGIIRPPPTPPRSRNSGPKPQIDVTTAAENFLKGFRCGEADLWEASPIRPPDDWTKDALAILENHFHPGELVNFVIAFSEGEREAGTRKAEPQGRGETVERDALLRRWRQSGMPKSEAGGWLRLNPLDGRGVADFNVTAFRFALVECDRQPAELQMALLAKLPLPIAAILTSGGRSLHAWVKVDATDLPDYKRTARGLLRLLGRFGVDGQNQNPSRMSRLPGVVRTIGAKGDGRQRLLYLNPTPEQRAIL